MCEVKVSVIIPVYNVEKYLHECMDSIINQTLKEIEIICVDDGSTDSSLSILNDYASKDNRITVVQQENQGAGVARNTGLDLAKGEYLSFLDPDDFFELNMLEATYNKAIETDVDIVIFGCNTYNDTTNLFSETVQKLEFEKDIFTPSDISEKIFNSFGHAAWNKLFKSSFIKESQLYFQPLFRANDKYFTCIALATASKIAILNEILLYYRIGMNTKKLAINDKTRLCFYQAELAIKDKLKILNLYDKYEHTFFSSMLSSSIYHLNLQTTKKDFYFLYDHLKENLENDFNFEEYIGLTDEEFNSKFKTINIYYIRQLEYIVNLLAEEYIEINGAYFFEQNDNSVKISVIIPVYNVEKYLVECLDSITNQTLKCIEIICINDGSTDNSMTILKELASKDERIRVFNQKNQGLSITRNKGIYLSKGDYVYFIDSDDKLRYDALEILYRRCLKNNLDILYFDGEPFYESYSLGEKYSSYKELYSSTKKFDYTLTGQEMFLRLIDNSIYKSSACMQIVKKELLTKNNIKFKEKILHEDNLFTFQTLLIANRVQQIDTILYLRRVRDGSIVTTRKSFEHFYGYFVCYINMVKYIDDKNFDDKVMSSITNLLTRILKQVVSLYKEISQEEKSKLITIPVYEQFIIKNHIISNSISSVSSTTIKPKLESIKTIVTPVISIILPIYNMEKYLSECLDSILNQNLRNIEIICVNDGSTDKSKEIIDTYAKKYINIVVVHQENKGVGESRNVGIRIAKGQLIAFMDPDDFYPNSKTLSSLHDAYIKSNALIVGGSFSSFDGSKVNYSFKGELSGYIFKEEKHIKYSDYQFDYGFQRFLYNRKMLIDNNVFFPTYSRYQDPPFFLKAMLASKSFYAINKVVYRYRTSHKKIEWTEKKLIDALSGMRDNIIISKNNSLAKLHSNTLFRIEEGWLSKNFIDLLLSGNHSVLELVKEINENIDVNLLKSVNPKINNKGYLIRPLRILEAKEKGIDIDLDNIDKIEYLNPKSTLQKIKGGIRCLKENGVKYTIKRILK